MITILLAAIAFAITTILARSQGKGPRPYSVHVLAISAAVLIVIARAASSSRMSECALDSTPTRHAAAKLHR